MNPADRLVKAKAAAALAKKAVGLRYTMGVVALNGDAVGGTHGRLPDSPEDTPIVITSSPDLLADSSTPVNVTAVKELVLTAHELRK
ncbi:hypothetical protein [Mycobacterium camsae]|uniref:hypothetical protein n=1 Tax=Mycobacterium gordonae TaxID=1778 RepID=UPI001F11F424|nr:hypothetical protein [Mycobacterium gordonae]